MHSSRNKREEKSINKTNENGENHTDNMIVRLSAIMPAGQRGRNKFHRKSTTETQEEMENSAYRNQKFSKSKQKSLCLIEFYQKEKLANALSLLNFPDCRGR